MQPAFSTKPSKHTSQPKQELNSGKVYDSCFELPLYNFVKRVLTGDNKWLIKEGEPTNFSEAWATIYSEYVELNKADNYKVLLELKKQIEFLDKRLVLIYAILKQLAFKRNEELIKLLQTDFGYRLKFDDLEKDIPRTLSLAKALRVQLEKAQSDYAKSVEENEKNGGSQWTEDDYVQQLVQIGKYHNTVISMQRVTVAEYINLLIDFKKYIKASQR